MPELPDVELYLHALRPRVLARRLERVRVGSPFTVRTFDPPVVDLHARRVEQVSRLGKRIVMELAGDLFVVVHLMVAGRFRWRNPGAPLPGRAGLLAFDFEHGTLLMTEAGTRRQASVHVVRGRERLAEHDRGGLEIAQADLATFASRLGGENHTLKRALTDPTLFSGIGNAYSDEILHAARLSPTTLTAALAMTDVERLFVAARDTLLMWTHRLIEEAGGAFPEKVTPLHPGMAVHGRYGQPCPVCGEPIQRIVYARNEANYCSRCQTGGRLLSDRALSRLLGRDWPKTLEEMESRRRR